MKIQRLPHAKLTDLFRVDGRRDRNLDRAGRIVCLAGAEAKRERRKARNLKSTGGKL